MVLPRPYSFKIIFALLLLTTSADRGLYTKVLNKVEILKSSSSYSSPSWELKNTYTGPEEVGMC